MKARKFKHYYELIKFTIGPKVIVIVTTRFLHSYTYFSNLFGDLVRAFFELFGRK